MTTIIHPPHNFFKNGGIVLFDSIIIGGGASGLSTAIMIKKRCPDLNIAIFEQLDRVGKKISVTGNGRCNITNRNIKDQNYYSAQKTLAMQILSDFSPFNTKDFFAELGVEMCFEGNKAFPRSFQASSVVDALRFSAANIGIQIFTSSKVLNINTQDNYFSLMVENSDSGANTAKTRTVVIATGGLAGGSKLGSNGDGYKFLKNFGHNIIPQSPVIVQVKTENNITKSLKGIKVNAGVTVERNNKLIANDYGEVLFCDYGLSGPPILQLSRYCKQNTIINLDMFSDIKSNELAELISNRRKIFTGIPLTEFFAGLLHKRIGQAVLKSCNIYIADDCSTLKNDDCQKIARALKKFSFKVTGNTGFVNAQATSGGADLKDFNKKLMSLKQKGLFAVGEVLDVDGDCGGYNLQWAWSSANTVANSIISFLER